MHDLPEGPYFDWVGNIATAINRWRISITDLKAYHNGQKTLRQLKTPDTEYTCFDTKEEVVSYGADINEECKRKGVWREDAIGKWAQFIVDVDLVCPACSLSGFEWSEELAASASELVSKLSGCNVWAHNVKNSLYETSYLESIATFADH